MSMGMHISLVARLYGKPAKKALEDESLVVQVYEPLRRAVVAEVRSANSGRASLDALLPRLDNMKYADSLKSKNTEAFKRFCRLYRGRWTGLRTSYLDAVPAQSVASLGGHPFSGKFHFCAQTTGGALEYVYVHASESGDEELAALAELLSVVGESRHRCERGQVTLLDLRTGTLLRPPKSFILLRKRLTSVLAIGSLIEQAYSKR